MLFSMMEPCGLNRRTGPAQRKRHEVIIRRFQTIVEANLGCPLRITEISRQIGVSSRSLRLASQQRLGISPTEYFIRRRMYAAHQVLRAGKCAVTEVATEFGFWELGRFSSTYRKIYGESPSETRKSSPRRLPRHPDSVRMSGRLRNRLSKDQRPAGTRTTRY
jgi:transcriptional regulator GlxA family with amidase domain